MEHASSGLVIDHFTKGLFEDQIGDLVTKYSVFYEVSPHEVTSTDRELTRHGWKFDLYATRTPDDGRDLDTASRHVHDVLAAIVRSVLPEAARTIDVRFEPYHGAVHPNPLRDYVEEVRLRVFLEPWINPDDPDDEELVTDVMHEVRGRLEHLGVKHH